MPQEHVLDRQPPSLADVHQTVSTAHTDRWRRFLAFAGPAYLISVGYMDPGNWATDLEGGARFGYQLLWVLVLSNLMAILLQTLSARLGIITGRDLAQACREEYPAPVSVVLWVLSEVAIIACDLAEVLGAAIGLNLLFHLPLLAGVLVTAADTLLILWFTRLGIRVIEAFVLVLIASIAGCFLMEIVLAKPGWQSVAGGLIPRLDHSSLYVAVGILGATVMPHNLYLHSALVQTRRIGVTAEDRRRACWFNFVDSAVALNGALLVNAAILVLAGAVFYSRHIVVTEIQQAYRLLSPMLGTTAASLLFGAALLCSGQSSTLTGTMAGQVVMEGFVRLHMQPWLRRAITRVVAILPAALTIYYAGERGSYQLLILSQVVLSIQLPFAVIPLVCFTSDRRRMGGFVNSRAAILLSFLCAAIIIALNAQLVWQQAASWAARGTEGGLLQLVALLGLVAGVVLLAFLSTWPWVRRWMKPARVALTVDARAVPQVAPAHYSRILVTIDHSSSDQDALANALTLAKLHQAELVLLHIEEGVTSQVYGSLAESAEVTEGREYLEELASLLRSQGASVRIFIRHGRNPAREIRTAVSELKPDLLVMAAHGHRGIKDLIFGTTINAVRHDVDTPLLVVKSEHHAGRGR